MMFEDVRSRMKHYYAINMLAGVPIAAYWHERQVSFRPMGMIDSYFQKVRPFWRDGYGYRTFGKNLLPWVSKSLPQMVLTGALFGILIWASESYIRQEKADLLPHCFVSVGNVVVPHLSGAILTTLGIAVTGPIGSFFRYYSCCATFASVGFLYSATT